MRQGYRNVTIGLMFEASSVLANRPAAVTRCQDAGLQSQRSQDTFCWLWREHRGRAVATSMTMASTPSTIESSDLVKSSG